MGVLIEPAEACPGAPCRFTRLRRTALACLAAMLWATASEARAARTVTEANVEHAGTTGEFTSVVLTDDGEGGDATASDGVFTAAVPDYSGELPRYLFTYTLTEAETSDDSSSVGTSPTTLHINELMASNSDTILDPQGDDDDWIELLNSGDETIDLSGMYLSDKTSDPLKWQFPSGTSIAAGGYLLVWADDDSGDTPGLHANFKLSAGGESVVLSDIDARDNRVIDSVDFPALDADVSYGRSPEATGAFGQLAVASPGQAHPDLPNVSVSAGSPVTEGGTATFTVTATPPPSDDLPVAVAVVQGEGQDYLPDSTPTSVTVAAGASEAALTVEVPDDAVDEPDGVLTATLQSGEGYLLSSPSSAELRVLDDDGSPAALTVVINELMASNGETLADPQGDYDDWIELHNTTALDIDLAGMHLSDDRDDPTQWQFPEGATIEAGGYLLIWADKDTDDTPGLHADFKLSADGESVVLSDTDDNGNAVIDAVDFPALARDQSYARVPDGTGPFVITGGASPGTRALSNDAGLSTLALEGVEFDSFSTEELTYSARVAHERTTTTITAAPNDARATVAVAPEDSDANAAGHQVSLAEGDNAITVTVTAEDGTTTRTYTVTVTRAAAPLTGRFTSVPDGHAGAGSEVVLRLAFSEPVRLSYVTLRDEAFEVTGGSVRGARRVDGRNDLWDIVLVADSDADLTVALPATSDCAASGAVCTGGGKPFSHALEATVPGPPEADKELNVSGVPQVGGTLQAPELEGTGPAEYRWLRDGLEIAGATSSSHVLTGSDEGAEVSVRVTRSGVTRVSAATIPIWGAPGNPPLGADEEELLGTVVTVGSTRAYPIRLGGYGRTPQASFGSIGEATLAFGGASTELEVALVGELGSFGIGPPPAGLADEEVWAYWDGHRIGPLTPESSVVEVLSAQTPQPRAEYRRYGDGSSEGVRVALSIRRVAPPLTATLSAPSVSVAEGADAAFEIVLDAVAGVALTVPVSVTSEGEVLAGEVVESVTVELGSTEATLALATDDDAVVEGPGSVTVTLLAGDGYKLGETVSATVTVEDDDVAEWALSARPSELVEGDSATLEAEVTNGVTHAGAVALGLSVAGDLSASDYALGSAALELPAGEAVVSTTLSALADGEDEDGAEAARIGLTADGAEVASALVSIRDASSDASLSSLSLTDVDIGVFDPETTDYAVEVGAGVSSTVVTAEPADANAAVVIADASGSTAGTKRISTLVSGANEIAARVTAEDGETERTYAVTVTREAGSAWGERLPERDLALPGVQEPTGVWSDGNTLWASNWKGIHAFALAGGARRPSRDVADLSELPSGLWSDGTTLWHSDQAGAVRAFRLSDGVRTPAADLPSETLAETGNGAPAGLWSDGAGLRVVDLSDGWLYGYGPDGGPAPGLGLDLRPLREDDDGFPWGLWSDGETALVTWFGQGTLNAFRLSDGSPRPDRDIDLGAHGNDDPRDLWSDGEVLWVADGLDGRLYAYAVPGLERPAPSGLLPVVVKSRAMAVPGADPGVPAAIPDPGLRARIAAALGKAPGAVVGIRELQALEALDARGGGIVDLTGLEGAVNLEALDLGGNPLSDLRALARLPKLAVLNLDGTGTDAWAVAGLTGLERLSLRGNGIADPGALSGLQWLEALDLGDNAVTDLAGLVPLDRLRALRADHNAIADIAPLAELDALDTADLRNNRIVNRSPLADLAADINTRGNPAAADTTR